MAEAYRIYGRENCVWCDRAKALLTARGVEFRYVALDRAELKAFFAERPKLTPMVPQIYLGDRHIGGYAELEASLRKES